MKQIIRLESGDKVLKVCHNLWIGGYDAYGVLSESGEELDAVLSVLNDSSCAHIAPTDKAYMRLPVPDGPGFEDWHLAVAVDFLGHVHCVGDKNTLVHCWAGWSRSVGVVAAYLYDNPAVYHGNIPLQDPDEIMDALTIARGGDPKSTPMPYIRELVRKYCAITDVISDQ